jgi:hypothetical protein
MGMVTSIEFITIDGGRNYLEKRHCRGITVQSNEVFLHSMV